MSQNEKSQNEKSQNEKQNYSDLYLAQMSEKEKKAYEIAKSHLGCSFHLEKSDGFLNFMKKQNTSNYQ